MLKKIVFTTSLVFFWVLSATALDLNQAKQIAIKNNQDLMSESYSLQSSRYDYYGSLFDLLPSGNLTGSYQKYNPDQSFSAGQTSDYLKTYGFSISMPIFIGGKSWLGSRIKKDTYQLAKHSYTNKYFEVCLNTETKYYKVLETAELLKIAQLDLKSGIEQDNKAKIHFNNATISSADYLKIQAETARKKVRLFQSKTAYELSMADLQNYLMIDQIDTLESIKETDYQIWLNMFSDITTEQINDYQKKINQYIKDHNITLKISEISSKISEKSVTMAMGNFLPSVNLSFTSNNSQTELSDSFSNQETLLLSASVPIFPVADNYMGYLKSKAGLRKSMAQKKSIENNIDLASKSAFLNLISSSQSVQQAQLSMQYSEESYKQMEVRFQNGMLSVNDMIDADIMLTSAKNQYISNVYSLLKAKTGLLQLLNSENDEQLIKILKEK